MCALQPGVAQESASAAVARQAVTVLSTPGAEMTHLLAILGHSGYHAEPSHKAHTDLSALIDETTLSWPTLAPESIRDWSAPDALTARFSTALSELPERSVLTDARLSLLWPTLGRLFSDCLVILAVEEPEQAAARLRESEGIAHGYAAALWQVGVQLPFVDARSRPNLVLSLPSLRRGDAGETRKLLRALQSELDATQVLDSVRLQHEPFTEELDLIATSQRRLFEDLVDSGTPRGTLEQALAVLAAQIDVRQRAAMLKELEYGSKLVRQLQHLVRELRNSRRWKIGHSAGELVRRLRRQPKPQLPLDQLEITARRLRKWTDRLKQPQKLGRVDETPTYADVKSALALRKRFAGEWTAEQERQEPALARSGGLVPSNRGLKVLIGTMSAGEQELSQNRQSVKQQRYKRLEHTLIEGLDEKAATAELMRRFHESGADVLIKLDADMVILDRDFVQRVATVFGTNPRLRMLQMGLWDYYTGSVIQGINAYHRDVRPWQSQKQDPLFTDRFTIPPEEKVISWTAFCDAVIHSPNPSPLQAFHFGVHRGVKIVQPHLAQFNRDAAEEQMLYLERTWEHFLMRRDRRLGLASLGFELALTRAIDISHLAYSHPKLHELYEPYANWNAQTLEVEVRRLRELRSISDNAQEIRGNRQALMKRYNPNVTKVVALVPHVKVFGGINRFFQLARAFEKLGVKFSIAVPDEAFGHQGSRQDYSGIEVTSFSDALKQTWDVVLCGDYSAGVMLTMPYFKSRLSVIYLLNGWSMRVWNIRQIELSKPDLIIANSSYSAKQYADLAPALVAGGVDLTTFKAKPGFLQRTTKFRVGAYPGRRRSKKRFEDVVEACRHLHERGVPLELHMYDDEVFDLNEAFQVVHHGRLDRFGVAELLTNIDVMMVPEQDAGWSNPAAEAMACGTPLVCCEAGTSDFAIHEETALVVPSCSPHALADAAERIYRDEDLARRLRAAGLERVREFDWTLVAGRLLEQFRRMRKDSVYREIVNSRAREQMAAL